MTADQPQRPEPTTEAGRALLGNQWLVNPWGEANEAMRAAILAIEAEARAAERTESGLREAARRLARHPIGTLMGPSPGEQEIVRDLEALRRALAAERPTDV